MITTNSISPPLKMGLTLLGMWPDLPYSTVCCLAYITSILIIQYYQYMYIFTHFGLSDLSNFVDGLAVTLNYSLTFFKLSSFWMHRRVFYEILTMMEDNWRECCDAHRHLRVMTTKANISHFCSNVMLSINVSSAILYLFGGYAMRFLNPMEKRNNTSRQLPVKLEIPFEVEKSPTFELLAAGLFLHVISHAAAVAILNALLFTLVLHISGQIDIMCRELKEVSIKTLACGLSTSVISTLIKRHNKIISFAINIEELFSFIALMQLIWNTIVMGCLGFLIVISVYNNAGIVILVKTIIAYVGVIVEVFIFCFVGEYLSSKGKSISDAAYESLWYDMPADQTRIILFVIMRAQKRLAITAARIMDLSLEGFTKIIKASASYISILHALY